MADDKKSKRIKSILGYLQEDVPGVPVDAQTMDDEEQPPADAEAPADVEQGRPPVPNEAELDQLMGKKRKKRQAPSSADAFEDGADEPTWVNGKY